MLYHVIFPNSGGHVSVDYHESLKEALDSLGYCDRMFDEKGAIAKGRNGEPLNFVVYFQRKGEPRVPLSVHATTLGAKRAYLKFGRSRAADDVQEYGFMPVTDW